MPKCRSAAQRLSGSAEWIAAHHRRGKLAARERIELLLDRRSFGEFESFVTHRATGLGLERAKVPGDGV